MDIKEDKCESSTTADSSNCENINIDTSSENKGNIKCTKKYEKITMQLQETSQPLSPNSTIDSEDDFSMIYDDDENSLKHQNLGEIKSKIDKLNKPKLFVKDIKLSSQPNKEKKNDLENKSVETMDINASDIDSSEAEGDYSMISETIEENRNNDDNSKLGKTIDSDKYQKDSESNVNTTLESNEDFSLLLEPDSIEDENTPDNTKISNNESFETDKCNIVTGITNKDSIDDFCLVTKSDILEKSIDKEMSTCEDNILIITPSEKETEKQMTTLGDVFKSDNNMCVSSQKLNDESSSKTCDNNMTEASNEAFKNKLLTDEITKTIDELKSNKKKNKVNEITQDSVLSQISDFLETKPKKSKEGENTEKTILESDVNTIKEVKVQNVDVNKLFKDNIDCASIKIKANNSGNNKDIKSADIKFSDEIEILSDNTSGDDTKIKLIDEDVLLNDNNGKCSTNSFEVKNIDEEQVLNDNYCIEERTPIYKISSDETESLRLSPDSMDIDNTYKNNKEMKQNETVSTEKNNIKVTDKLNSDVNSKIIEVGIEPVTSNLVPKNGDSINLLPETKKIEILDIQDSKLNAIKSNEGERMSKLIDSQPSTSITKEIISEINLLENKKVVALKDIDDQHLNKVKEHLLSMSSTIEITTDAHNIMELKDLGAQIKQPESQDLVKQQASVKSIEPQPSTSLATEMTPDASDEIPEVTDSLGLLAETIRSVEDEDQEDDDDGDDEEDDYQDEESCPMTTEHSEDSNTHQSETEQGKDQPALPVESNTPNFETDANAENAMDSFTKVNDESSKTDAQKSDSSSGKEKVAIPMDVIEVELPEKPTTTETENVEKPRDGGVELKSGVEPEKPVETPGVEDNTKSQSAEGALTCDLSELNQARSKKLEIHKNRTVYNIVDLEESSSDDDVKIQAPATETITEVIITQDAGCKDTELDAQGGENKTENVPNKCDTPEVTIKPSTNEEKPIVALEPSRQKASESPEVSDKPTASVGTETPDSKESHAKSLLEIFNLDSDDDDKLASKNDKPRETKLEHPKLRGNNKCCNQTCASTDSDSLSYVAAPQFVLSYYQITNKRHSKLICTSCYHFVSTRMFGLLEDYKDVKPLSEMMVEEHSQELVEISDSDSDLEDTVTTKRKYDLVTDEDIEHLEAMELESILDETWKKYNLDDRLKTAKDSFEQQVLDLESESKKIDDMFKDCQTMTDTLRRNLYATFAENIKEMEPISIIEPDFVPTLIKLRPSKPEEPPVIPDDTETRRSKRTKKPTNSTLNTSNTLDTPLNTPNTSNTSLNTSSKSANTPSTVAPFDDDTDISVVKLSAESAPPDLPPPGDLVRYPPRPNDSVYVTRNSNVNGSWVKAKVVEQMQKGSFPGVSSYFTVFKIRIEKPSRGGSFMKFVHGKQIAYFEPAPVRLAIGTRVISLFKNSDSHEKSESYYSGIVAEMPTPVNNYRYLIFFDDGYAQYVSHLATRAVCENSPRVWEDVHPDSAEFLRKYLVAYPERPMVRLHAGQMLKTEWNGKWWNSKVLMVDASLVKVYFDSDDRTEWIYRGSTRLLPLFLELQAAERHRPRGLTRANKIQGVKNMPYVEYIRSEEHEQIKTQQTEKIQQEERKQRAVAKKSTTTTLPVNVSPVAVDSVTSRVVFYTPKSAVKPYKMTPHVCSARCRRTELLTLKELRTYNPLARPLLSGWERVIVRFKGRRLVMYRAPCGRRLRTIAELHRYLQLTDSEMGVDLFDFCPETHCLAEFVLNRCNVSKKDLSHGKENVPVPCVNYYDNSLPEFCSYNTERTPTAGVPLNLDPEFLCGCDCTDDCQDKSKCACWKTTLEGAKTIGLEGNDLGYVYRRLPEPLPSGIFECNSRCSCRNTCLNRVAQHPLQLKLQVFKTLNRGWGIRALNDIPKGAFLCVYAGNLLTDATANLDGLNEGDEYLAELDYIEVVEQMKEGYEEDIPDADKEKDKKSSGESDDDDEAEDSGNEQDRNNREEDDDFRPTIEPVHNSMFSKRLRKREKKKDGDNEKPGEPKKLNSEDDCITISDDEEVRKPSRFTAQAGMDGEYISKYKSVRTLFGEDEACYIVDAKVQGNIGRYLNHSCSPNVFVQNVFVDTHDPRFPWVAFFALRPIGAGTELTWNYNYDIGSVPGKLMYCHCGAPNCRGRLL